MLLQELCTCRRENERLTEELFGKADDEQNLEVLLNQLEQEKQRLTEKTEKLEIKGKSTSVDSCKLSSYNFLHRKPLLVKIQLIVLKDLAYVN